MSCKPCISKMLCGTRTDQIAMTDVYSKPCPVKQTGIICTIGPASNCVEILEKMIYAGMTVARLNFSHGTHETHKTVVENVRQACANISEKIGIPQTVALALDTKGPEIRTGILADGVKQIEFIQGEKVTVTINEEFAEKVTKDTIYVDYAEIVETIKPGNRIYVDDGQISLLVEQISGDSIVCTIENGGKLSDHKGINLPGVGVDLPTLSDRDKDDIRFGVEQGIDLIFASFIRSADAVREIREFLGNDAKDIMIIPKIENIQGVRNAEAIIQEADGLMVARGDLGIEVPMQKVNIIQKSLTAYCLMNEKPVICATQMLDSMTNNPVPTRAEIADVMNAVMDGVDCVMLSGESAGGKNPVACVKMMAKICKEAESAIFYPRLFSDIVELVPRPVSRVEGVAVGAVIAAAKCCASVIIAISTSGKSATKVSKYRPCCPVIAITRNDKVARQTKIRRGLIALYYTGEILSDWVEDVEVRILHGLVYGQCLGLVKPGDRVVTIAGWHAGGGHTNTMRILTVSENIVDTIIQPGIFH